MTFGVFQLVNEEIEALENFRRTSVKSRTSLREKYMSLLEEKKHELDDLKQQADETLSRPTTSTKERKPLDSLENGSSPFKKQLSFSPLDSSNPNEMTSSKENRTRKSLCSFILFPQRLSSSGDQTRSTTTNFSGWLSSRICSKREVKAY